MMILFFPLNMLDNKDTFAWQLLYYNNETRFSPETTTFLKEDFNVIYLPVSENFFK